ncbi:hypothetical protein QR680_001592 [Steinernema hermaphroditum]|uniref:Transmembrane protein 53 n=1 Tax=Steinernema hermaphroditum TaxID=289476 RepID=A0AA39GZR0_9BILA|nr:hypothetical protein QR680_001592 [Steinernema hermaphroditum]
MADAHSERLAVNGDNSLASDDGSNETIKIKPHENLSAPVVVLFGWAGCQDRYLAKYSQIYENQYTVNHSIGNLRKT